MRAERLDIFGFKSFMERLVLPLESGITGVVGPNGCGKSNIIDALRWVLGETKASSLRGDTLEDVIFNGTESFRPLGLAEVSLVIRSDKENLYQDILGYYEEIEADNLIPAPETSGTPGCEASTTDAASSDALSSDAGACNEEHSVAVDGETVEAAGQAQESEQVDAVAVGEVIDAQNVQVEVSVPLVCEPANQDTPIAEKIKDAAPADFLTDIKASLSKYAWLQSVSEVQVTRRLYRSGESEFFLNKVPCRLKDIKEFFRVVGLAARGYTIIAQGEIGRIITAKPDDRRVVIEEAAHIAGFREHMNAVGKRVQDTNAQVVRLDDVIKEVTRQVASLKRQAARAVARAEIKEQLKVAERELHADTFLRIQKKVSESAARAAQLEQEEATAQGTFEEARGREQTSREEGNRFDAEVDLYRTQSEQLKDELNKRAREIGVKESRLRELNSVVQARTAEIQRLEERKSTLVNRRNESQEALNKLQEQSREIEEGLSAIDLSGEEEIASLTTEIAQLREDQRNKERLIRELRDKLVSAQSRREALQAQLTAASPLTQLKRALGGEFKMPAEVTGDFKLLVDGIKVPDQYTKALQAVLAERASFLVVEDVSKVARTFQELVLKADPQNKKGIGLGLFAQVPAPAPAERTAGVVEGVTHILSHVQTQEWSKGLVERLLANVWVADDLDAAIKFSEAHSAGGEPPVDLVVVTRTGDLLSPWSFYSLRHEGGIIQVKSKVDEATLIIEENQGLYDVAAGERDAIVARLNECERRHAELVRAIQQAQARLRELSNRQGEVRGRLQSEARVLQQLENDVQKIEPQSIELREQIVNIEQAVYEVAHEIEALREQDNSELEQSYQEVMKSLREVEEKRRGVRDNVTRLLRDLDMKRQAHEAARDRLMRERMTGERIKGELSSAQNAVLESCGEEFVQHLLSPESEVGLLADDARRELDGRVHQMRLRLEREGEVDPACIEQYEVENKRLEDLTVQREDLVRAIETLSTTLVELSEACARRFIQTFEAIRRNFALFAPKLYGGGSAELHMSDPGKPLESGIEIIVRPPGKKPKSIDLLSGGEKALCAIALVFAMFMVRPSPLCVLDEVDAPLDEANVHRFVAFIKEMSARTQFLMITHNKQSMAAADTLVGVTMPQPGASKVLTVSLQDAVKHAV
jgi:chromosome segregation protein